MGDSKKRKKQVVQREQPKGKQIEQKENPDKIFQLRPSWNFSSCDTEKWTLTKNTSNDLFWDEFLPRLKDLESQTWNDILILAKKQNHSLKYESLNSVARERIEQRHIEAEAIISLRVNGRHRIYGYLSGAVFNILWYDLDHGDNATCVCRSAKKHT